MACTESSGRHCFLAVWFHGYSTFRYGRSFVLFGFDEEIEDQRVWGAIWMEIQTQLLPHVFACAILAWRDLSVLYTNNTWTWWWWGEHVILKFVGIFFSLQKEVISHFDWGLKSHSVPLVPQKYQHAHSSPARECHGQWAQPFIQRFSYHFYSFEQT